MKKLLILLSITLLTLLLTACGKQTSGHKAEIKIGTTESQLDLWNEVKKQAEKQGIQLKVVVLTGAVDLNQLTVDGEIDANAFQHMAYLYSWNKIKKQNLVPVGSTIIAPLGIYSKKLTNLKDLRDGSKIAVPNDESNWPRALTLLQSAGLIKLKDSFDGKGGNEQVAENPKHLKIIPMESANLPRVLEDVDAATIINGTALQAGYHLKDSLYHENKKATPYINVIATTKQNKNNRTLQKIAEIFQSKDITNFINKHYEGNFIPVDRSIDEVITDYEQHNK